MRYDLRSWIRSGLICLVCVGCLAWHTGCATAPWWVWVPTGMFTSGSVLMPLADPAPQDAVGVRELNLADDGSILYIKRAKTAWFNPPHERVDVGDAILRPALNEGPVLLGRVAIYQGIRCLPYFSERCVPWRFFVTSLPRTYASRPTVGRWLIRTPGLCAYVVDENTGRLRRFLGSGLHERDRRLPDAFNVVEGQVPIDARRNAIEASLAEFVSTFWPEPSKPKDAISSGSGRGRIGIYSMHTGQLKCGWTAPGGAYACFQVPGQEPIWWGSRPYFHGKGLSLMQGNKVLVPEILQLLAITPDCSTVFFTMWVGEKDNLVPTLVSYDTQTGSFNNLMVWSGYGDHLLNNVMVWSGYADLRVRSDSQAFGLLNVSRRGDKMTVNGCTIMDLKGGLIEDIRLPEPITVAGTNPSVYIGPRAYDWNLDTKTIAYWDEASNRIIVQELGGSVLRDFTP